MEKFSATLKPSIMYHITPVRNVSSIKEEGLAAGKHQNTQGVQLQRKIYLTNSLKDLPNLFPHKDGWQHEDLAVFAVETKKYKDMIEIDPEYVGKFYGKCWMCSESISASDISCLGAANINKRDQDMYDVSIDPDSHRLDEVIRKRGNQWVVLTHDESRVLGTHDTEEKAQEQLRAIEASKARRGS